MKRLRLNRPGGSRSRIYTPQGLGAAARKTVSKRYVMCG